MKEFFRIKEIETNVTYDDKYESINEALNIVEEYVRNDEDENEPRETKVTYQIVNQNGEEVFRVTEGKKFIVNVLKHPVETKGKAVSIDDLFEASSDIAGGFDTLEEAQKLYATLPAGYAREMSSFSGGRYYLHYGKFIEECEYNKYGQFVQGSNVWDIDVPDYEEPDYEEKE